MRLLRDAGWLWCTEGCCSWSRNITRSGFESKEVSSSLSWSWENNSPRACLISSSMSITNSGLSLSQHAPNFLVFDIDRIKAFIETKIL